MAHDHGQSKQEHHHHDCCSHDATAESLHDLDPANRSLASALQTSFSVLRWVMLVLCGAFLLSGLFNVQQGEVALVLRFGKVAGADGSEVKLPGGPYFAWPDPIDQVIYVSTAHQELSLDDSFWFQYRIPVHRELNLEELSRNTEYTRSGLVPGSDGALLTGDKNIVHGQWSIAYKVEPESALDFVANVWTPDKEKAQATAEALVRTAAERAIVHLLAQSAADDFLRANLDREVALREIQRTLEQWRTGIRATQLILKAQTPPLATRTAFNAVLESEIEKANKIERARRDRSRILNQAAGSGHRAILEAIDELEKQPEDARAEQEAAVVAALEAPETGGRAAEILAAARTQRTRMVEKLKAEAEAFLRWHPQYKTDPHLVRQQLWLAARERILSQDVEKFYFPPGDKRLVLELNRDPEIRKRREREIYRQQQAERNPRQRP